MATPTPTIPQGTTATQGSSAPASTSIIGNGAIGPLAPGAGLTTSNGALVAPPSGPSSLPKPTTTPTGPTGVASSDLATQTLATQQQGTAALNQSVQDHAANKAQAQANPAVSIVDLLNQKGLPSDYTSRAKMAQVAGIQNYVGSAQQNAQLIGWFNSTGGAPNGGTTPPAGGQPGGSTSSTTGSSTSTSTTGTPQVNTGSPGDAYEAQISDVQNQIGQAYDDYKSKTDQIINGTFPLSPSQQAVLDATTQQFAAVSQQQLIANKSYENAVALAGNRLGTNIQNPAEYAAEGQKAVSDDLQKISNLDATATVTLANLKQGFLDKDYTEINDQYTNLQKTLDDKNAALTTLQTRVDNLYTSTRDYNEKVTEFAQSQAQQKEEFEATYAQNQAKFVAQYAGLIDPNTGLFKPSEDPTTLPGVTALPNSIGGGSAGYYLDVGQIADKSLATYLEQAAKQNGYGVVDTSQNKTFNQALTALTGLQSLIGTNTPGSTATPADTSLSGLVSSGNIEGIAGSAKPTTGYTANTPISDIIGNKKSNSLVLRLFGSTQPDAIQSVFGTGGGSVPNLNTLTLGQAESYLQNSVYTAMGTNTVAQKYAMNPTMATTDLTSYYSASPANSAAVNSLLNAHPDLTDSQIMQILTSQ